MSSDLYALFLKAKAASDAATAAEARYKEAEIEWDKVKKGAQEALCGVEEPCKALFTAAGNPDVIVVGGVAYKQGYLRGVLRLDRVNAAYITSPQDFN